VRLCPGEIESSQGIVHLHLNGAKEKRIIEECGLLERKQSPRIAESSKKISEIIALRRGEDLVQTGLGKAFNSI